MKKIAMVTALALFWTGCYHEYGDSTPEEPEPPDEICGNGFDDDRDSLVDESDCIPPQEDADTDDAADDDAAEDTLEDTVEDTLADVPEDTATDTPADCPTDTTPDTIPDSVPDTVPDSAPDTAEDTVPDSPSGPPPALGWVEADFRDWVTIPGDAVESSLNGTMLTAATYATLPGTPSALCAFGSWNGWSHDTGTVCMSWSPSFTPGRPFYTRGGDIGWFFVHSSGHYEVDLSRLDFVDTAPCYRAAASRDGMTRLVLRCPALPELDICTNDLDDDHDGLTDDEDPDCDTFWEPPVEPDMTNRLAGTAIGDCINMSGTFWFETREGYGLSRALNPGEYVSRFTAYHNAMSGCDTSPCWSVAYPGDGVPVHFTICSATEIQPAVITSWGATLKLDLTSLVIAGDICRTSGGTALTAWGIGACGSSSTPPSGSEICDGADNDADGLIDEGFTCRVGAAESCTTSCGSTGTRSCSSSCTWGSCIAPSESCNGRDDDCDGTVDEYCSSGERFEIIGRDYGTYREIEVVSTLNADHSMALADNPSRLDSDERIGAVCVVYGSTDWNTQIWDPYYYHEDPPPCVTYTGDGASHYLHLPSGVSEFLLFAIGTRGDPRHRVWFNIHAWSLTGVRTTTSGIFSF